MLVERHIVAGMLMEFVHLISMALIAQLQIRTAALTEEFRPAMERFAVVSRMAFAPNGSMALIAQHQIQIAVNLEESQPVREPSAVAISRMESAQKISTMYHVQSMTSIVIKLN